MEKKNSPDSVNKSPPPLGDTKLYELSNSIESFYWVPFLKTPFSGLEKICKQIGEDRSPLSVSFKAFTSNLIATEKMLQLPYALAASSVKYLPEPVDTTDMAKYQEWVLEVVKIGLDHSLKELSSLKYELNYLMYQACILIWSALENYCKDVFIIALNHKPQLYKKLLKDPFLKDRFSLGQMSWEKLLDEHGFNLNGKLGQIIAGNKDFSSPNLIQKVFFCILDEQLKPPHVLDYFKEKDLLILGQRRHLIAHRAGIIDVEYLKKTKEKQKIGEQLVLRGFDIAKGLAITAQCAMVLYATASLLVEEPNTKKGGLDRSRKSNRNK